MQSGLFKTEVEMCVCRMGCYLKVLVVGILKGPLISPLGMQCFITFTLVNLISRSSQRQPKQSTST